MEKFINNIDRQIAFNQGKNLLYDKPGLFRFLAETTSAVSQLTNIESCGIDRFRFTRPNLFTAGWLEYDYGVNRWGTVINHLGFTNHFSQPNLREDGNYIAYGRTYMNILRSLKIGGSFHYAPGCPSKVIAVAALFSVG